MQIRTDYNINIDFSWSSEHKEPSEKSKDEKIDFGESHDEEPMERANLALKPMQIATKDSVNEKVLGA